MRTILPILLLWLASISVHAGSDLVTIQLHHRSASEVIEILRPMLDQGGSISGSGYKLFIRSSVANIEQLRQMIAGIDVAARNLLISVSMNPRESRNSKRISGQISVQGDTRINVGDGHTRLSSAPDSGNGRIKYDVKMYEKTHRQSHPQMQQVRVSEGLWATIHAGQSVPLTTRRRNPDGTVTETTTYESIATGFRVLPRVHGDTVTLTIRPQAQSAIPGGGGAYSSTGLETTVTGGLGQWIALGGVSQSQHSSGTGILYNAQSRNAAHNQIYVKVELIQP